MSSTFKVNELLESQNFIPTVLSKFKDSAFALNQSIINVRSCSNIYFKNFADLWLLNIVVSSANKMMLLYTGSRCISFINIINSRGPKQLPCAAP